MIQFDNNIPVAPKVAKRLSKWASLVNMQPGQSFFFPSRKNSNGSMLRNQAKKYGIEVTLRYFSEPNREYNIPTPGYRVYCTGKIPPALDIPKVANWR